MPRVATIKKINQQHIFVKRKRLHPQDIMPFNDLSTQYGITIMSLHKFKTWVTKKKKTILEKSGEKWRTDHKRELSELLNNKNLIIRN